MNQIADVKRRNFGYWSGIRNFDKSEFHKIFSQSIATLTIHLTIFYRKFESHYFLFQSMMTDQEKIMIDHCVFAISTIPSIALLQQTDSPNTRINNSLLTT